MVEPTTAQNGNGYKYIRATFSDPIDSLEASDIEIRAKKNNQLYSVETVSLSSDGLTADITLFGDVQGAGTSFLDPATIYVMKIAKGGDDAVLEFELPDNQADMLVVKVDSDKNMIYVASTYVAVNRTGAGQKGGTVAAPRAYKLGDVYDGNLGELIGRTVNLGINSDSEVVKFDVNDAEVVYTTATTMDGDDPIDGIASSKDYFVAADKTKYYLSTAADESSSVTRTYTVAAKGATVVNLADDDGDGDGKGVTYDYAKLVLNPNGTVSCAVLEEDWDDLIIATSADAGVVTETKTNSKDFSKFTIVKDGQYIAPKDIEAGDIVYYNDADKFAEVYAEVVVGTLDGVYTSKLSVDGELYDWAGFDSPTANYVAERYDADNSKYVAVTEKWLLGVDTDEDVTLYLNRAGKVVLLDAVEDDDTTTTTAYYVVTGYPVAYLSGKDEVFDIAVSDGTKATLTVNAANLKSLQGKDVGKCTIKTPSAGAVALAGKWQTDGTDHKAFVIVDGDTTPNSVIVAGATDKIYTPDQLLKVTCNDSGDVIGLDTVDFTDATPILDTTSDDKFKAGLTSIQTSAGKVGLTEDTNVWVIDGKKADNSDTTITKVAYSDFDKTTNKGKTDISSDSSNYKAGNKVKFYVSGTTATDVVIDASVDGGNKVAAEAIWEQASTKVTTIALVSDAPLTGLNKDKNKTVLKGLKVLNADNKTDALEFTDIKDGIVAPAKGDIVKVEQDSDGQVIDVTVLWASPVSKAAKGAADRELAFTETRFESSSTDTLFANGDKIKAAEKALVVVAKADGSWELSSIGAINRDNTLGNISFYVSEIQGNNIASELIIAYPNTAATGRAIAAMGAVTAINLETTAGSKNYQQALTFTANDGYAIDAADLVFSDLSATSTNVANTADEHAISDVAISAAGVVTFTDTTTTAGSGASASDATITFKVRLKTETAAAAKTVTLTFTKAASPSTVTFGMA